MLEAELITPPEIDPRKVYPVWFMTYGGPHMPTVSDGYANGRTMERGLAADGFVVFRMDPRSASTKGVKPTWTAYKHLGVQEMKDVEDAINWLKKEPYVDGTRIGMSGHSYGGYLTAYCMTHTDLFAAGIAGHPVTDWRDYDSIYTERYMLTPQENPEGYNASSVVRAAENLHGRLLILHGLMDDNVSIRNTVRLVDALQRADKDFEMMIYPPSRHGIGGAHYQRSSGSSSTGSAGRSTGRQRRVAEINGFEEIPRIPDLTFQIPNPYKFTLWNLECESGMRDSFRGCASPPPSSRTASNPFGSWVFNSGRTNG